MGADNRGMREPAPLFADRADAGRALAGALVEAGAGADRPLVVGLARGGVPVAAAVATALGAPLDVVVVRKIGHSLEPELALGAVAAGGQAYVDPTAALRDPRGLRTNTPVATREAQDMDARIRERVAALPIGGRDCVLVDDGLATGATMRAALAWARAAGARRVTVAVPVADRRTLATLGREADGAVCPHPRDDLWAVGLWYRDFGPVSEEEVIRLLEASRGPLTPPEAAA